jgi:16S rRNA (cytidine1402-2'-O)-methyltransferase
MLTAMPGTLFIVATPIGNLEDITPRALRVLREVDLIACEDTRHTRVLLNRFGIKAKTISYHEHNERASAEELCRLLESGKDVALVSDAGTPLISDPGFRIVRAAIERGVAIVPVPGPTALVAALVASGLPSDQFFFAGFLPARASARRAKLEKLRAIPATLVFYEAPHRIAATLKDALNVLGDRAAMVARELTKLHEEIARGNLDKLAQRFCAGPPARGEMVLLIGGANETESRGGIKSEDAPARLATRVSALESEGFDSKAALRQAARELGLKRAEAYRLMVAQKKRRSK